MYYYQVGGLGAHTTNWFGYDIHRLSDFIFSALSAQAGESVDEKKKNTIELVLGILSTGSSYLLISEIQMDAILRFGGRNAPRRPLSPRHASIYASLSPIAFHSPAELHAKLKTYVQKAKPGKTPRRDTSQANKMFDQQNPARASFEHQRVLWSAIQNPIDINKFALCELPVWIASTSLVALTLQTWRFDPFEKRRKDPTVLSLGLASVRCIAFEQEDYADQVSHTIHVKIEEHATMTNGPTTSSNNAMSEVIKKAELGRRLNDFFASIDSKQALLLVYDAEQTRNALEKLGVDVSSYQTGINTLLYGQNREQESHPVYANDRRGDHRDQCYSDGRTSRGIAYDSRQESRMRSRSPQRRSSYPQRPRSPPFRDYHESRPGPSSAREEASFEAEEEVEEGDETEAPPPAKVYVIDVHALFLALSRLEPRGLRDVQDLASRLNIPGDPNGSNAGNECRLLIEAWRRMASGKAIDEQYAERWSAKAVSRPGTEYKPSLQSFDPETSQAGVALAGANADEEIDPNDILVNPNAPQRPLAVAGGLRPPTDDYDSDDSDFS